MTTFLRLRNVSNWIRGFGIDARAVVSRWLRCGHFTNHPKFAASSAQHVHAADWLNPLDTLVNPHDDLLVQTLDVSSRAPLPWSTRMPMLIRGASQLHISLMVIGYQVTGVHLSRATRVRDRTLAVSTGIVRTECVKFQTSSVSELLPARSTGPKHSMPSLQSQRHLNSHCSTPSTWATSRMTN